MKLYYADGTCSLSPHIVALEAGLSLELERVDIKATPHQTESGVAYASISPNGYVPALRLDDGSILTEGAAIVQYLADQPPGAGLAPTLGTPEWYRFQQWLSFIGTELHKMFSPWLFHPEYGADAQVVARRTIAERFHHLNRHLSGATYLVGVGFTAADAYCFTVVAWSVRFGIDLALYPHLAAYMDRIGRRSKVQEALEVQGVAWASEPAS
jgi:glutathione S-transferase